GASPRATIALCTSARALALLSGRNHVVPGDIADLAHRVLQHRLILGFEAASAGVTPDVVIDAVGRPETWKQAFYARDLAGTVVLVGVPTPEMTLEMPLIDFFSHGGSLKSSWYGDCLPERDFPQLVDLYQQGRLPLEKFVTERITIEDVEAAFEKMHQGTVLRSVVVL
ncbi:MAG: zinc-binding dehydrogenase, partial [Rhodococcus sp. (in: high G+C Gram-positive bacteria)]